jgi:hypothetical protein
MKIIDSSTQMQVEQLIDEGYTQKAISKMLGIARSTVCRHVQRMKAKPKSKPVVAIIDGPTEFKRFTSMLKTVMSDGMRTIIDPEQSKPGPVVTRKITPEELARFDKVEPYSRPIVNYNLRKKVAK